MKRFTTKKYHRAEGKLYVMRCHLAMNERKSDLSPKHYRYRGIAFAWTALVIITMIMIVGLSIDGARLCLNNHRLQNGADAGALAGAMFVKFNQDMARDMAVATTAENYAEQIPISIDENLSNDPAGELVIGRWIRQLRQFVPTTVSPSAVKVVSRRLGQRVNAPQMSYIFGPLADVYSGGLERHAVAWSQISSGAGIITLAEYPADRYADQGWNHETGLLINGGPEVDLRGYSYEDGSALVGDIQVNSQSTRSPWASFRLTGGSAEIYAGDFNISGTSNPDANDASKWEDVYGDPAEPFSINPERPPIEDPLAGIPAPIVSGMTIHPGYENTVIDDQYVATHGVEEVDPITGNTVSVLTLAPGYYPGGIHLTGDPNFPTPKVVLSGGSDDAIFAFAGGNDGDSGLVMQGGSLVADGTMIYITGDETHEWGQIRIRGNTSVRIVSRGDAKTPPEVNGEIGIAIWQDRSNPTFGTIIGSGDMNIVGTIYCGYNPMEVGGTSDQMGNQLIAGALHLHGTTPIRIAYDGRNGIQAFMAILVE
jgi:hypothetical protein